MKTILISPFAKKLRNGKHNSKSYPYWKSVVAELKKKGHKIVQIGVNGEELIGADEVHFGLSLDELVKLAKSADVCASVDNFFHHLCWLNGIKCVVLFSKSDPNIFGHKENINLLKGREHLRARQFDIWELEEYDSNAFVDPHIVVESIEKLLGG